MIVFGGLVAQSVEQCPFKALVESSSLSQPTSLRSPLRSELRLGKPETFAAEIEGCRAEAQSAQGANNELRH